MKGGTRWIAIGCGGLISLVTLCFCGAVLVNVLAPVAGMPPILATVPPATETSVAPTDEVIDPTTGPSTDEPTVGLGASRTWWDANHTKTGDDLLSVVYDDSYVVTFVGDRAQSVEARFQKGDEKNQIQIAAGLLLLSPRDVVIGEEYQPDKVNAPETFVVPCTSAWLADKFSEEWWFGSPPGTFMVIYHLYDGKATSMRLTTGNNP